MKLVAKIFILLNDLLLFAAAVIVPVLAVVAYIKNPNAIGADIPMALFILWLGIYELLVVISFGVLAIIVENYRNLQKIADALCENTPPANLGPNITNIKASSPSSDVRREPSIQPRK